MTRSGRSERIGLEVRLYWVGGNAGGKTTHHDGGARPPPAGEARLLETAVIERGRVGLVDRQGTRPRYDTKSRASTPLARLEDGRAYVTAPPGRIVEVRRGTDERWHGPEAVLGPGAVARIADGPLLHELRLVPAPVHVSGLAPGLDTGFARRLALSALFAAAVVAATFVVSLEDFGLADRALPEKLLRVIHEPPAAPRRPPLRLERPAVPAFSERSTASRFGEGRGRSEGAVWRSPMLAVLLDVGDAGGLFSSGIGAGINRAVNDLRGGDGVAELHGLAGLGPRGGAGLPGGSLGFGIGSLTGGTGPGDRGPFLLGGGGAREAVRVHPGRVTVVGGLAKEVIGKTIRARQRQVVACYERELQKDPDLEGKLAVSFVIDGAGSVTEVTVIDDTLGRSAVAECVQAKIRAWRFPAPEGGGQVVVNYPWIFRSAGAE